MRLRIINLGLVLAAASFWACASVSASDLDVEGAVTAEEFSAFLPELRQRLRTDEAYRELSGEDRVRAFDLLDRMETRLGTAGSVDAMRDADKIALLNDQEQLNVILTAAREDSRLVCRRERTVGSRMATNTCLTVAQRRRLQETGRETLNNTFRGQNLSQALYP